MSKPRDNDRRSPSPLAPVSRWRAVWESLPLPAWLTHPVVVTWLQWLILFLLPVVCYIPVMNGGFIWDDNHMVYANPLVQADARIGLGGFWFTRQNFDYFPLTSTSFWLEWRLWGTNAAGYHVTNILLHAAAGLLLWRVLRRLRVPAAWLCALLFAIHPVAVASVAWIAERKNTLAMIFNLTAVLWYLRWRASGWRAWGWYVASLAAFALALLSKTAVVVTPIALGLIEWWLRDRAPERAAAVQAGRKPPSLIVSLAPYLALSIIMGSLTILFQYSKAIGPGVVRPESMLSRLIGMGWCLWFYVYKALLPTDLMMVNPRWVIDPVRVSAWLPLTLYLAMFAMFWRHRHGWARVWLVALGVHGVMVLPVLGFFKIYYMRFALVGDHWQYFALAAPVALVAGGAAWWAGWRPADPRGAVVVRAANGLPLLAPSQTGYVLAAAVAVAVCAGLTWRQASIYKTEALLWTDNIAKNPQAWVAYNNLAVLQPEGSDVAVQLFQKALDLNPDYHEAFFGLGQTYRIRGERDKAFAALNEAVRLRPDFFHAQNILGLLNMEMGDDVRAARHLRMAVTVRDEFAEAWSNLGVALQLAGDKTHAEAAWRKAWSTGHRPDATYLMLAQAQVNRERFAEAEGAYQQALAVARDPVVLVNYGQFLEQTQQRRSEAEGLYREALRVSPGFWSANYALGVLLTATGRAAAAVGPLDQAAMANPRLADIKYHLGNALYAAGQKAEALRVFELCLQQNPGMAMAAQGIGVVLLDIGRHAEALSWFDRAFGVLPGHGQIRVNRAKALIGLGRVPAAIQEYTAVAEGYEQAGLRTDAIRVLDAAIAAATNAVPALDAEPLRQRRAGLASVTDGL